LKLLFDHREVGNDVPLNGFDQRGPVVERRIFDLAAFQMIVCAGANPVDDLIRAILDGASVPF